MKRQHTRIKEIEGGWTELAHLLDQRAKLDAEILQLEAAQEARLEDAILEAVRRWRIARLPIGEVLAVLEQLADTQNVPVAASESALTRAGLPSGDIEVVVKLSKNASLSKRRALAAAGLHWHGRLGRWTGKINALNLESLLGTFGDRVEVRTLAAPADEGGSGRVDAQDNDASALDADVKAIAADLPTVAEPVAVEPRPIQSAATASLRVSLHALRGFPRVRPLG
jgi:hypothetical protein